MSNNNTLLTDRKDFISKNIYKFHRFFRTRKKDLPHRFSEIIITATINLIIKYYEHVIKMH